MKYWTKSWNTVYGCTKVRAGCLNCWALEMSKRICLAEGIVEGGNWTGKVIYKPERIEMPLKWKKPQIVAVNWMSDTFHENLPNLWFTLLPIMQATPQHTYLILTKRYDALTEYLYRDDARDNIYIGVTISSSEDANDAFVPVDYAHSAGWKTWVSYEPALEKVDWTSFGNIIDGMVCGAESGRYRRTMPIEAAIGARDFCYRYNIPFTFKQGNNGEQTLNRAGNYEFPRERIVLLGDMQSQQSMI